MSFLESTNRQILDPCAIGLADSSGERTGSKEQSPEFEQIQTSVAMDESLRSLFEDALIRGDERECRRILIQWYSAHQSFASVADGLIAPTFNRLGDLWKCGEIEIFQERRSCEVCSRLIHEFRRLIAEPMNHSPLAIGGSASGDHYALPGQLIEVVLRETGWRAVNLGCNLPFATLSAAVRKERPRIVFLSVSHVADLESFLSGYSEFANGLPKETSLVVGGRALTDQLRPHLQYTAHCDTMKNLSTLARAVRGQSFQFHSPEI